MGWGKVLSATCGVLFLYGLEEGFAAEGMESSALPLLMSVGSVVGFGSCIFSRMGTSVNSSDLSSLLFLSRFLERDVLLLSALDCLAELMVS